MSTQPPNAKAPDTSADAHGNPHGHKGITIHINTREFQVQEKTMTYQELVNLAYPGDVPSPDKIYEITYSDDHGHTGRVGVGGYVKLKKGMVFNVGLANRS